MLLKMRRAYRLRAAGKRGVAAGIAPEYVDSNRIQLGDPLEQYRQGRALIMVPQGVDPIPELAPIFADIEAGKTQVDPGLPQACREAAAKRGEK